MDSVSFSIVSARWQAGAMGLASAVEIWAGTNGAANERPSSWSAGRI